MPENGGKIPSSHFLKIREKEIMDEGTWKRR
jgi:hypothetical protein